MKINLKLKNYISFVVILWIICIFSGIFLNSSNMKKQYDSEQYPMLSSNGGINLITPENRTYTEPMHGYYPATFGFENDEDGIVPSGWNDESTGGSTSVQVINSLGAHEKVIELYDNSGTYRAEISNTFSSAQEFGTIEFWTRSSDVSHNIYYQFYSTSSSMGMDVGLGINTNSWRYYDSSWHDITSAANNRWYHVRIDFECGTGGYEGLTADTFYVHIDGIKYGPYSFYISVDDINQFHILTDNAHFDYYSYLDAISYSWDPNYNIRENLNEGFHISFDSPPNLDWIGYSLNNQANRTILGNTTIYFPGYGLHTLKISANDSIGTLYNSELRYFSINSTLIEMITPLNITYIEPMEGYYPSTYGFESDINGDVPKEWDDLSTGSCSLQVISEMDGHKKVLKLIDTIESGYHAWAKNEFNTITYGTVEAWFRTNNVNNLHQIILREGTQGTDNRVYLTIENGKWRYRYGPDYFQDYGIVPGITTDPEPNKWYHLRIDFESSTGNYLGLSKNTWKLTVNNDESDILGYHYDNGNVDRIIFATSTLGQNYDSFVDAVSFSWDPNYNVSDNKNEGLLLSINNETYFEDLEYSLDDNPRIGILGNTSITIPSDGLHGIQVFGITYGVFNHESEIRNFTIDMNPYVKWQNPVENETVRLPPENNIFHFSYNYRDINNVTLKINGINYGSIWNKTSLDLVTYSALIDGPVVATLYGFQDESIVCNNTINFTMAKILDEINVLIDEQSKYLGPQLYLILHDPNGDGSYSELVNEVGNTLVLGVISDFAIGGGVSVDAKGKAGASASLEYVASADDAVHLKITQTKQLTSNKDNSNPDYIGPGNGDVYWGESLTFGWRLYSSYRTYYNGSKLYEEATFNCTIERENEVFLNDYNAPEEWRALNPVHNNWQNVTWDNTSVGVYGNVPYQYIKKAFVALTHKESWGFELSVDAYAKIKVVDVNFTLDYSLRNYLEYEFAVEHTTGYTLYDDESTDFINMRTGIDLVFGTPIFQTLSDTCRTSNPLENNTYDYINPTISFPSIEYDTSGDGIGSCSDDTPLITVALSDEGGIQRAMVRYSLNDGLSWNNITFNEQIDNPGFWYTYLPSQPHGTEVKWYVIAWDNQGRETIRKDPYGEDYKYTILNSNPVVSLVQPIGGESYIDSVPITWTATDLDGDDLTYKIAYNDGGIGWRIIASNLVDTNYEWNISSLPYSDSILIKIIANDGYDGIGEDYSDFLFTIGSPPILDEDRAQPLSESLVQNLIFTFITIGSVGGLFAVTTWIISKRK